MIIGWLILAWIGGVATILGSLMTIASLIFSVVIEGDLKGKFKLLGFSIGCTIAGFLILRFAPVPFE
ncbi:MULTISPECIES: hypothetical protein [Leptolyngbya]|jgi:drug/metabolite transporter superfamily protein YnfA|uniref:Uncharacterized protein n=2 Tax=Leptolyngbya boryana TaxID=1184 RepID=A0A1Z4JCT3_LEPBY|nr:MULTISPECIES: hypothetical protein [Leptolyngbya]BAY54604.1 hypothetical protein NIES2135_14210 [Leptolyngbya boryana NIES-2135]MBD1859807.1 hypothetical protein [Leptolyngbya sp. FACHB-1624]MBD2365596.1 hypothetical protein [Leptolyngbya sp. FACHB-161]MBD2371776.1 hypothetical protein [Leptolyngbya sp. FACHB-238]MBD2396201.1 hypothetical protein [Leptolyngbya sp. FACHB-239]